MSDFETWVRSELAVLADVVRPSADPYAHLARRRRWSLLRRGGLLAGVAALVAAGVGTVVALAPAGSPEPRPTYDVAGRLRWVAGLVDAPPRGAVAQDAAFRDDLAQRVEQLSRTEPDDPIFEDVNRHPMGEVDAWVVFADDLADRRVAAVAMQRLNIADPARRYPVTRLLWLVGNAGTTPEELLHSQREVMDAAPAVQLQFSGRDGGGWLVLAPGDCVVETSPVGDLDNWQPSPTGSYLVRIGGQVQTDNWHVACAGVVREQRPGTLPAPTTAELQALGAGSAAARADLSQDLQWLRASSAGVLVAPARVLWAGPVTPPEPVVLAERDPAHSLVTGADVIVLTAPSAQGGWIVGAFIDVDQSESRDMPWAPFLSAAADPGADGTLLAARLRLLGQGDRAVFALAPAAARSIRVLDPAGGVVTSAPVTDRAALFRLPTGTAVAGLRAEALDDRGRVIATAELLTTSGDVPGAFDSTILDWD